MKVLTCNIECGKRLSAIKKYLLSKQDFDAILLQEVAGGYRYKLQYQDDNFDINKFEDVDVFNELNQILQENFNGFLAKSYHDTSLKNYVGNAIFINKRYKKIIYKEVLLGGNKNVDISVKSHSKVGYTLQRVYIANQNFTLFNTHIIKYKADAHLAKEYLLKVKDIIDKHNKFLLGGDFNMDYNNKIFRTIFADFEIINKDFQIVNTLNRDVHRLFKKNRHIYGLSVDNFIASKNINPRHLLVEYDTISDHYPVTFEFFFDGL